MRPFSFAMLVLLATSVMLSQPHGRLAGGLSPSYEGEEFRVIPQPAGGMVHLIIRLPGAHRHELLKLYDASGRDVLDLTERYAASGYLGADFEATGLGSGLYFCRLEGGSGSHLLGIVVVRH